MFNSLNNEIDKAVVKACKGAMDYSSYKARISERKGQNAAAAVARTASTVAKEAMEFASKGNVPEAKNRAASWEIHMDAYDSYILS